MYDNATITNNTIDSNVSANDTQFDFSISANVSEQISALIVERKDWDMQNIKTLARSNKRLYQILSGIYNMGLIIVDDAHPDQDIKGKFDAYCKAQAIKFHKDTSYFVRICKVVFGANEGNRYSAYGNALNVAKARGVQAGELIEFIEDVGGIEDARRLNTSNQARETIAAKASKSLDQLTGQSVARITDPAICSKVDKALMNGKAVLFVSIEDDGSLAVHAVSQTDNLVNRVIVALSSSQPAKATGGEVNATDTH